MKAKGIFYVLAIVSDLKRSKEFYEKTLGWKLGTDEANVAGFSFGSGYLVLHAENRSPEDRVYGGGMYVEVQVEDAAAEHARLSKLGLRVSSLDDRPWGERHFSFTDPDGYLWFVGQAIAGQH